MFTLKRSYQRASASVLHGDFSFCERPVAILVVCAKLQACFPAHLDISTPYNDLNSLPWEQLQIFLTLTTQVPPCSFCPNLQVFSLLYFSQSIKKSSQADMGCGVRTFHQSSEADRLTHLEPIDKERNSMPVAHISVSGVLLAWSTVGRRSLSLS